MFFLVTRPWSRVRHKVLIYILVHTCTARYLYLLYLITTDTKVKKWNAVTQIWFKQTFVILSHMGRFLFFIFWIWLLIIKMDLHIVQTEGRQKTVGTQDSSNLQWESAATLEFPGRSIILALSQCFVGNYPVCSVMGKSSPSFLKRRSQSQRSLPRRERKESTI